MSALRFVAAGALDDELAALWSGVALAEVTHAPTGFPELDMQTHTLGPGEDLLLAPASPRLVSVLEGRLAATHGSEQVVAGAGDSIAVAAGIECRLQDAAGHTRCVVLALNRR